MKTSIWDIVIIAAMGLILTILSETNTLYIILKLPFISLYALYLLGRFVGYKIESSQKTKNNQE